MRRWNGRRLRRTTKQVAGNRAEALARHHLEAAGLVFLTKNFRCRLGEIDLVMRDRDCLVFVEVRFRQTARFVAPVQTVDRRKQRRIAQAAGLFLSRHPSLADEPVRFDVVAVDGAADGPAAIQWLSDAFRV